MLLVTMMTLYHWRLQRGLSQHWDVSKAHAPGFLMFDLPAPGFFLPKSSSSKRLIWPCLFSTKVCMVIVNDIGNSEIVLKWLEQPSCDKVFGPLESRVWMHIKIQSPSPHQKWPMITTQDESNWQCPGRCRPSCSPPAPQSPFSRQSSRQSHPWISSLCKIITNDSLLYKIICLDMNITNILFDIIIHQQQQYVCNS